MIVDIHTRVWHSTDQLGSQIAQQLRRWRTDPWSSTDASAATLYEAASPVEATVVHGLVADRLGAEVSAESVAEVVRRDPSRFMGFAGVDPTRRSAGAAIDEAVKAGLVGVTLSPALSGFHPAATYAMDIFEQCEACDLPVMIESISHFAPQAMMDFAQPWLLDEPLRAFPKLKLVIGSLGYPFMEQTLTLVLKHEHVYTDVAGLTRRPWELYNALIVAHQRGATDRLLFGSGFPMAEPQEAIMACYSVNSIGQGTNLPSVPREQIRTIIERDALTCLGLRDKLAAGRKLLAAGTSQAEAPATMDHAEPDAAAKPTPAPAEEEQQ